MTPAPQRMLGIAAMILAGTGLASAAQCPAPTPINIGAPGIPYAGGPASGRDASGEHGIPFDYIAFCSAPSNNGRPRSAAFIEACLAGNSVQAAGSQRPDAPAQPLALGAAGPTGPTPGQGTPSAPEVPCTPAPTTNGVCGAVNGQTLASAPVGSALCGAGTAMAITGSGPWSWVCASPDGGFNSPICTAQAAPTPPVPIPPVAIDPGPAPAPDQAPTMWELHTGEGGASFYVPYNPNLYGVGQYGG